MPDRPRWSKPRVNVTALRAFIGYGAMSAIAVTVALVLRDGPAWEHPAPWLTLKKPAAIALSAALGFLLSLIVIGATRVVVARFSWGRRLHRDLRPMARDLSTGHILLLAGLSSLGEELLFRGLLLPAIGVMVCNGRNMLLPDDHFTFREHHSRRDRRVRMEEQEEGYSGLFYVMLILGIIGVLGFLMVAAGAGAAGGL